MKAIARVHPFLLLAALTFTVTVIANLWSTPFHDDAVGVPRLFYNVWDVLTLPYRFLGMAISLGLGADSRFAAILVIVGYLALLVALDQAVTRFAGASQRDAA